MRDHYPRFKSRIKSQLKMLNKIINFSVNNKLIIGFLTIALLFFGIYQTTKLPIDAVPDITENQVQVITVSPSLGAPDVERLITFPIEQANSNIPGIKEIRSFSRFGLSLVTIVFDDDTDIYWARQQVSERLQQVSNIIPQGAGVPELAPVTTGLGEIYQYVVKTAPGYEGKFSITDLRTIQDWIIRRQLLGTKGVADVSSFGGELKQYDVIINDQKLNAHKLSITDIYEALEKNNANAGGTYIERGPSLLFIRTEGMVKNKTDIENTFIKRLENGAPLLVGDVASVETGVAKRYGAMCYNDEGEVAGAVVMMLKGENSSAVIASVKEKIDEIRKTLPEGIVIEAFLDRTKMVNNAIGTVETNLAEGALIVLLILVIFLGNFRAGLIVASVIPLAMLFAISMMNLFGVSGNLMSLGALDFGLIVDGAVIIVEAVMHRLTHSKHFQKINLISKEEMNSEVKSSASKMMNAAVFGQIIILIVYLPILSLQGIEGKMFKPMAQTVAFALIGAFILSLTYIPMMSSLILSRKIQHKPGISDRIMFKLERGYEYLLNKALMIPKLILSGALILFSISIIVMTTLGGEFIPELEEGDFAVDTRVLTGSNLHTTIKATQQAAKIIMENFPEVEKVVTKIGSGEIPTDPMPIEASDMMVILKDKSEWTSAKTFDEMAEKMSEKLSAIPGITAGFQYPVQMRFNELMTGARQDVVCKIFGDNLDSLAAYAEKLGTIVRKVDGAVDLYIESVGGMPQIVITPNRSTMALYGVNIDDINATINAAYSGYITGTVFEDEKRFNLVVKADRSDNNSPYELENLLISSSEGKQFPLRMFADVEIIDGPNQIQRESASRRIVVGFNVRGKDVETVVDELKNLAENEILFDAGYHVTYGGSFENMKAAQKRLSIAVPVSLLLILILLYFAFRSIKEGLIIFSAIPFSAIGGILALYLRDMPFSISAGVGFIALFGVAVLNGIVLMAEFKRLDIEGTHDVRRIVLMATKIRLRPVLMTAAVASLGFLPMALSNGAGAEVQRPLATVVIGGLFSATLLTLFVLPIIYVITKRKISLILKNTTATAILIITTAIVSTNAGAQSQHFYSLEDAINAATEKSFRAIKSSNQIEIDKLALKTNLSPERTTVSFDYGQMNTSLNDTKYSIQQNFELPAAAIARRQLYSAQLNESIALHQLSQSQIKKEITELYYDWQLTTNYLDYLLILDSLYDELEEKVNRRLTSGESEALELALIQNESQLNQQKISDQIIIKEMILSDINLLTGFTSEFVPQRSVIKVDLPIISDTSAVNNSILSSIMDARISSAAGQLKIEKAKKLPAIGFGYSNMSIRGYETVNNNELYHTPSDRFNTISMSIQLPILQGPINKRVAIAKMQMEQTIIEKEYIDQKNKQRIKSLTREVETYHLNLKSYDNILLLNMDKIFQTAELKLKSGDIDILDFFNIIKLNNDARMRYFELIRKYNAACIELNQITNK